MRKIWVMLVTVVFIGWMSSAPVLAARCGNGIKEGAEECDRGQQNSDSQPNGCRADCTLYRCGDWVKDSNEECDDGPENSDKIPNACRRDCRRAFCGDGVLDSGEECEDMNTNAHDGCHQCRACFLPKDNLVFNGMEDREVSLCPGNYEFLDKGQEGIIIINSSNMTLDCKGASITEISEMSQASALSSGGAMQNIATAGKKILSRRGRMSRKKGQSSASGPSGGGGSAPKKMLAHKGTGIVIKGQDVLLRNCHVKGFKVGVKLQSRDAALVDNMFCENVTDVTGNQQQNYGIKNVCSKVQNWQENGQSGCTRRCP